MKMLKSRIGRTLFTGICSLFCHFGSFAQVLDCTQLTVPGDGALDVSIFTDFEWDASDGATGYIVTAGTTSGGTDILENVDVGDVVSYNLPQALPPTQTIYVSITPYNTVQGNLSCTETIFTTGIRTVPRCTEIINPTNGDALVSTTANITWIRDFSATGYLMTVYERDPNGILIWDRVDVGNGTNAKPPDFKARTRYYVTIIPYNDSGPAQGCQAITFVTGDGPPLPLCTELTIPANNSTEVPTETNLEWTQVEGIDGYLLSVGTTPRGTDILDRQDTGLENSFDLPSDLPLGTRIYTLITTYKGDLESEDCQISSFMTVVLEAIVFDNIPRFFTPNNDGFNDAWAVNSSNDLIVENVLVFDRYGKLLIRLQPGQFWNGTFNGRELPSGSYWYSVQLANFPSIKGYFLLKR